MFSWANFLVLHGNLTLSFKCSFPSYLRTFRGAVLCTSSRKSAQHTRPGVKGVVVDHGGASCAQRNEAKGDSRDVLGGYTVASRVHIYVSSTKGHFKSPLGATSLF